MQGDSFAAALRAEIEAVLARYEALVSMRLEAVETASRARLEQLQAKLQGTERERDQLLATTAELSTQAQRQRDETDRVRRQSDALRLEMQTSLAQLEQRRLEAERRAEDAAARVQELHELSAVLDHVFAGERAFAQAAIEAKDSRLAQALQTALGAPVEINPATFGELKFKRMDVVLTHAIRDRGQSVVDFPLDQAERGALSTLASASGCELIEIALGIRYSPSLMEKVAVARDPAEEGNVVETLMPGLRLAGSDGALVFPKVKVAVG